MDDELSELVDQIPGFGGFFYDDDGTLTVRLTDPGTLNASRVKVQEFLGKRARGNATRLTQIAGDAARMRVQPARYDFRQLLAWYRSAVVPGIGGEREVTMTDVDERRNRIVIGVAETGMIGPMQQRVAALAVPPDAVEVIQFDARSPEGEVAPAWLPGPVFPASGLLTDKLRPVPGGAQISQVAQGQMDTCTLGFNLVAVLNGVLQPERYFVTASHCAHPRSQVLPSSMAQPVGSQFIGQELIDPGFFTGPGCPDGRTCRLSDAAVFKYTVPDSSDHGHVALPPVGGSLAFSSLTTIVGIDGVWVGSVIHKIGRVTGRTTGQITNSCANVLVSQTDMMLLCQGVASYSSHDGDSGAPIIQFFGPDYSQAYAVGIHAQSGGVFSHLDAAINEMYDSLPSIGLLDPATDPPPPPPPPLTLNISGPSSVKPVATCLWTAIPTSGVAPYTYAWYVNSARVNNGSSFPQELIYQNAGGSGITISVHVTDATGANGDKSKSVSVSAGAPNCFF